MATEDRIDVVGKQNQLFGAGIDLVEYKNIEEKRALKEKVKAMFKGEMIRSIITPRENDGNLRLNKLERLDRETGKGDILNTLKRADAFGKKTLQTLSTFPSILTQVYINLLTEPGNRVYDAFMGHNSRAEDVLSEGRKYFAYDVHTFPIEFTKKALTRFNPEDYELNLGSSEKIKYEDNSMDFSITCPPYADVEKYCKIYEEEKQEDLSGKDYKEFLWLYNKCLSETYRVLRPGSYFVIVVGDIHRNGVYTSLMLDTIKICKMAGFELHDVNIYNRRSNIGGDLNYKTFILTCKRFPTIHEFIIIFKKPGNNQNNNKEKEVTKNEGNM
jgi:DNA modification methylase